MIKGGKWTRRYAKIVKQKVLKTSHNDIVSHTSCTSGAAFGREIMPSYHL